MGDCSALALGWGGVDGGGTGADFGALLAAVSDAAIDALGCALSGTALAAAGKVAGGFTRMGSGAAAVGLTTAAVVIGAATIAETGAATEPVAGGDEAGSSLTGDIRHQMMPIAAIARAMSRAKRNQRCRMTAPCFCAAASAAMERVCRPGTVPLARSRSCAARWRASRI